MKRGWRATVSTRSDFVVRSHGWLLADRQDYATEAKEWAELIADNRIAELSQNWIFANYYKDRSICNLFQELCFLRRQYKWRNKYGTKVA